MGMYQSSGSDRPEIPSFSQRTRGSAAWGGIGCVMAFLLPVLAYFAALLTVEYNAQHHWFAIPPNLAARPAGLPISAAILVLTVGYAVIFYGVYATLYAIIYRAMGISPYTPLDLDRLDREPKRVSHMQTGKLMGVLGFLLALAGGVALVHLNLAQRWVPIPRAWQVPGPLPYAGVYVLAVLLVWAFLWAFWGVFQGLISALFYGKKGASEKPGEDM